MKNSISTSFIKFACAASLLVWLNNNYAFSSDVAENTEQTVLSTQSPTNMVSNGFALLRIENSYVVNATTTIKSVRKFYIDYQNKTISMLVGTSTALSALTEKHQYDFDAAGNLTEHRELLRDQSLGAQSVYSYNAKGLLVNLVATLADGSPIRTVHFSYKSNDQLAEKIDNGDGYIVTTTPNYNEAEQLTSTDISLVYTSSSDGIFYNIRYDYSTENGSIKSGYKSNRKADFKIPAPNWTRYYDEHGNLIKFERYGPNGDVTSTDLLFYERSPKPLFNYWLMLNRYFPEEPLSGG